MKRTLSIAALIVCSSLTTWAITLDDYYSRVTKAATQANDLYMLGGSDAAAIAEIRRLVPASEKVDWQGGTVETDNRWLAAELDVYTAEPDRGKRRDRMCAIFERLKAVVAEIGEIKRAEAGGTSKDENKQKLGEILRRPEYQKPEKPEESLFQRWYRKLREWLNEKFPDAPVTQEEPAEGVSSFKLLLQILIYAAVIGLIGFLLYKFGPAAAKRFGWRQNEKKTDRVILGERIAADETGENLFSDAERLAREGRLRDAIRKGYIAALCELADRNIVRLARHKTNRDYLRDVRKTRSTLVANMSGLTGTYEQNWYGLRASQTADWEDFRERYKATMRGMA